MAKQLSYADALKILGKNDSEVLDMAEKLADGGLGALGVPDLFGIRGMVVGRGRKALEGMRGKLRGESRVSRTEKILAAERILTVVSFFESVEEAWREAEMPFPFQDLEITAEEQLALGRAALDTSPAGLLSGPGPWQAEGTAPGPRRLQPARFKPLRLAFLSMVTGLAVSEEHGITDTHHPRLAALNALLRTAPGLRYLENRRVLATEVPEFGLWLQEEEHSRTRNRVDTGLSRLGRLLEKIASDRPVARRCAELSTMYRSVLRQPVLPSDTAFGGLVVPSLEKAYLSPLARVSHATNVSAPAAESWWQDIPVTDRVEEFMAAHLVHPRATSLPTVLLGHPGAGKSKFTEVLAARLSPSDFLPIRVELRSVPSNAPIHAQIEEGLAQTLNIRVSWRDLADSADGTVPVIILDGFDELLQATGVDRSDYLERVHEFQLRQETLGKPVAVIVTTRTVVADRARFPIGTTMVKLEPFDDARIERLLGVWNSAGPPLGGTASPVLPEDVAPYRELAEQPLLLMMLLIYDAEDGALRRTGGHLTHGELYERLLTAFAEREVRKNGSALDREGFERAVERELRRLEVTALAMFARRRQHVTAEELNRDLGVLMPEGVRYTADPGLHGRIDPAHQVLGRFFFVHEARARTGDGGVSVFEFLHATFGEYLVARAVVAALDYLAEARSLARRRRGFAQGADDGELYALLSFACLPGREKITDFLTEELEKRFPPDTQARSDCARLLVDLFQEAPFPPADRSHGDYAPARLPVTVRQANYTANLIVLLTLVREEPTDLRELFPEVRNPLAEWRNAANLWRTLQSSEWFAFLHSVRVKHLNGWDGDRWNTVIVRDPGEPVNVGECVGFELYTDVDVIPDVLDPYQVTVPFASTTSRMLRSISMRVNGTNARTVLGTLPYLHRISRDLGGWFVDTGEPTAWLEMHEILRLRLEPPGLDPSARMAGYRRLLIRQSLGPLELLVLRQAAEDARWPGDRGDMDMDRLRHTVVGYLNGVVSPARGSAPARETVRAVLESFPEGFLPDETLERVLASVETPHTMAWEQEHHGRRQIVISPPGSGER
ncbi:NACHT domain-containing NTPase [Nocardiopsis sp. CC223A]|uniref:NACHT domain-containing protein n=1 Tax=Nocardiopsis sp. CC223A TaxID=3044051 RepID=UPI00278C5D0A|nr:hypothetical protein [Nocardiopsis sp. CC223A]